MDKLQAMASFVEIVDRGSLTQAANALSKSLPTMVRVLADLEKQLGVRLLNRTTRRMALTAEGEAYLARCRQILADIAETEQLMSAHQVEPSGTIRLTAPIRFGQMHVAASVNRFLARHPKVDVELSLLDRSVDLIQEGLDVAVRIDRLSNSSMVAIPVGEVRRVVCASPALLKKVKRPRHPTELSRLPCVRFTGLIQGRAWRFREKGREFSVAISGPFACNHASPVIEACAQGIGFGTFLSYQVAPLVAAGQLKVVLREFELGAIPVNLVFPHARLLASRTRTFLDWIASDLREALRS